ncbi:MAG: hypothetical protein Q8S13_08285 [Dehalococcoidia bacterium]|nr:hypothetical protein [Dehalococcoidia bacterium]
MTTETSTRFQIRIDPWWQPVLAVGGGLPASSYVEVDGKAVHLRFGALFNRTIQREDIAEVVRSSWPWWMGVGWRTNLRDQVGLIGSYQGIVEIRLREPVRVWRVLRCRRIAVSLEEPGPFTEALAPS